MSCCILNLENSDINKFSHCLRETCEVIATHLKVLIDLLSKHTIGSLARLTILVRFAVVRNLNGLNMKFYSLLMHKLGALHVLHVLFSFHYPVDT